MEDALVRDRLITSVSFQHGLTTLGFKMSDEVSKAVNEVHTCRLRCCGF